jgi:hypothetical protein
VSVEKILHGNPFTWGLEGWVQNGSQNFVRPGSGVVADYLANDPSNEGTARILQYFSMSGVAVTALLNLHLRVSVGTAFHAVGSAVINVVLGRPDSSEVTLYSHEFTAGQTYDGQACSDLDISSYMNQVGTYSLKISSLSACSWYLIIDEPAYMETDVELSAVSLAVTEKLTKMVFEAIGGGELVTPQVGQGAVEGAVLAESLAHVGGYQEGDARPTVVKRDKAGLREFTLVSVGGGSLEGAGLAESLERSYNFRKHDLPGMPEGAGLAESLLAKWKRGNVTYWRYIVDQTDIWTRLMPVATDWEVR